MPLIFLSYSENSAFFKVMFITKGQLGFSVCLFAFYGSHLYRQQLMLVDQEDTEQMTDLLPPHSQALDSFS